MSNLSTNLLEVFAEQSDPAKWAAIQIVKGGRNITTVAEAFAMIESIVAEAIEMGIKKHLSNQPSPNTRKESDGSHP